MLQRSEDRRLLLMDDDDDDFLFLKEVTDNHFPSVRVTYVAHCDHVSKTLFRGIDLVLLDINMPRVNGFECLDLIRKEYGSRQLPVIMYSNSFANHDVEIAYEKGANLFAHKPGTFQKIKMVLETILSIDWTNINEITRQNHISHKVIKF